MSVEGKRLLAICLFLSLLLVSGLLAINVVRESHVPTKKGTVLSITPSNFTAGDSLHPLTATLTDADGNPVWGKAIIWSITLGTLNPPTEKITNIFGQITVEYRPSSVDDETPTRIVAEFVGDNSYDGSHGFSDVTIVPDDLPPRLHAPIYGPRLLPESEMTAEYFFKVGNLPEFKNNGEEVGWLEMLSKLGKELTGPDVPYGGTLVVAHGVGADGYYWVWFKQDTMTEITQDVVTTIAEEINRVAGEIGFTREVTIKFAIATGRGEYFTGIFQGADLDERTGDLLTLREVKEKAPFPILIPTYVPEYVELEEIRGLRGYVWVEKDNQMIPEEGSYWEFRFYYSNGLTFYITRWYWSMTPEIIKRDFVDQYPKYSRLIEVDGAPGYIKERHVNAQGEYLPTFLYWYRNDLRVQLHIISFLPYEETIRIARSFEPA